MLLLDGVYVVAVDEACVIGVWSMANVTFMMGSWLIKISWSVVGVN